ncbi:glycosyltransferase family 4 protein [Parvularcula lutaonensis]|uniref:Glycosyltransferase family 4 protein n=1 Tax=Parvularcula lutaonensis TaxID=491923 RepID=A0ABV7M783_9PROT|nr:hypothetical protein [Parvularcula lutaonensis]GGY41452.1 glycosyl transferase [Parvularcula lutaonensis]
MPVSDAVVWGLLAALLAGLLSNALSLAAIRTRIGLDHVSERSNHSQPTPRLGGMAVIGGLAGATTILAMAGLLSPESGMLLVLTMAAGAIGIADDFLTLRPQVKILLLNILAFAGAVLLGPVAELPIPLAGWVAIPHWLGVVVAGFWLLSIVNVVNFMDGLNGLAGSYAVLVLAAAGTLWSEPSWPLLAAQVAVLGFLFCNVFEGRIFLGDAGSLSLGFLLGAAPLVANEESRGFWLIPLVCLPLIADVALTLVRRAARGARLSEPHREHLYQRIKAAGWSHQAASVTLLFTGVMALLVATSMWRACADRPSVYWLSALFIVLLWAAALYGMLFIKLRRGAGLEGTLR